MHLHQRQNDTVSIATILWISPPLLPEELVREILLRLPVKSLVQFKCVCKLWKTLISNSQFAKSHLQTNKWSPVQVGRNDASISDLMFADDLLLFGEATKKQVLCVKSILETFCSMSGQDVSCDKSCILFSSNVSRSVITKLAIMSGFRETNSFGKYLGVPLSGKNLKKTDFSYITDQIAQKLMS